MDKNEIITNIGRILQGKTFASNSLNLELSRSHTRITQQLSDKNTRREFSEYKETVEKAIREQNDLLKQVMVLLTKEPEKAPEQAKEVNYRTDIVIWP